MTPGRLSMGFFRFFSPTSVLFFCWQPAVPPPPPPPCPPHPPSLCVRLCVYQLVSTLSINFSLSTCLFHIHLYQLLPINFSFSHSSVSTSLYQLLAINLSLSKTSISTCLSQTAFFLSTCLRLSPSQFSLSTCHLYELLCLKLLFINVWQAWLLGR